MLGLRLCVLHNLYFYNKLVSDARKAIMENNFSEYKKKTLEGFMQSNI